MKTYLRHKILNVIDIKELTALEYLNFEGKYREYVEKHNFWEVCYVEKGEITVSIDGEKRRLSNNDIIFITPEKTHSYFSERGNENRAFVICFECISQPMKSLGEMSFSLENELLECFNRIISEYKNTFSMNDGDELEVLPFPNFGGQQVITLQLEYLIICLLRMLSSEKNPEIVFLNKERFYADLVDVVIDYFRENIRRKISLKELCSRVNYSSSFLCKNFKEQTGETLFTYFNRMKMEEAKRLLKGTSMSVSGVSRELGFSDVKYFSAAFKKNMGITPALYKRKQQEKAIKCSKNRGGAK